MPRDFVPCMYYERVEHHPLTDKPYLCCDVLELAAGFKAGTAGVVIGPDSFQYTMRDTYSVDPQARLTATQRIGMRLLLRQHIFRTFYAAMAARE